MNILRMFENPVGFMISLLFVLPAILIALTLHELAHGYVAWKLGDPTAKWMGRLSLNPLKHLDPIGTFMLIFAGFGWAKPVPVDSRYFKNRRRDIFLVSVAGVTTNLVLCIISYTLYLTLKHFVLNSAIANEHYAVFLQILTTFLQILARFNAILFIFNLLPIPPLDGFHVLNDCILKRPMYLDQRVMQLGFVALLVFVLSGLAQIVIGGAVEGILGGITWVFNAIFL